MTSRNDVIEQTPLFDTRAVTFHHKDFPQTRYQGSKLKLLDWIWSELEGVSFDSAIDLFGGSASVSYLFKTKEKRVVYNDNLRSNYLIGKALIENSDTQLAPSEVDDLLVRKEGVVYGDFVERNYRDVFFLDDENCWLDTVAQNIAGVKDPNKQAMAYFALFQASLMKRPYNLFHRANLYMRTANVSRSFGNKTTWETPFEQHFRKMVVKANGAVFDNNRKNKATLSEATDLSEEADLVYIDPPYMNSKGVGVDYLAFYHFLEGLSEYKLWPMKISGEYKHKPYKKGTLCGPVGRPYIERST